MKIRILIFILPIFFISCVSLSKKEEVDHIVTKARFNKSIYFNEELNLEIKFDNDWAIFISYNDLNDEQKELFKYFNSPYDELLFIGFNEQYSIGVKCTNQVLGLENQDYLDRLKLANSVFFDKYKYEEILLEDKFYPTIEGIRLTSRIAINKYNVFIFDSLIFKHKLNNFKIDFWMAEEIFEEKKEYLEYIFSSINFKF